MAEPRRMPKRVIRSLGVVAALVVSANLALEAQTIPSVKLPPSPQGQSAVQLGGHWEKTIATIDLKLVTGGTQ